MKPKHIFYLKGQHCETTATGTLLLQQGIQLSEPMLFGLGEGLGFIFWKMKGMVFRSLAEGAKLMCLHKTFAKTLTSLLKLKKRLR